MVGNIDAAINTDEPTRNIIWIGTYQYQQWHPDFIVNKTIDDIAGNDIAPELIILSLGKAEQDSALKQIRSINSTSLSLIFVVSESTLSPYLANGIWDECSTEKRINYRIKKSQIKISDTDDLESKLLCYLWLHEDTWLEPCSEPSKPYLFSYPLLNTWGVSPEDSFSWIKGAKQHGWIEEDKLINRVRYCPICRSGHLNYIDVCPKCHDMDIEDKTSLHCFNCGHVGGQDHFRKTTQLQCPNCLQNLRHIGVDYDRPIENQHCNSCDTLFVDALVKAECLDCHQYSHLDQLYVHKIYNYRLGAQGRLLIRQGRAKILFTLVSGEQMSSQQFYWLIDWQNKVAKRHNQVHSILSIQMHNIEEFLSAEGETKGLAQLDALQQRIQNLIRVTDA